MIISHGKFVCNKVETQKIDMLNISYNKKRFIII